MAEGNEAAAAPEKAESPKGGGNKLILILALVNFLAVLGLGGYLVYSQRQAAAQPAGKDAKKDEKAGEHGAPEGEAAEGEHAAQEGEHEAPAGEHGAKAEHGKGEHGKAGEGEGDKASDHDDAPSGRGPLLALEPLVTNLADPDADRYLKVGIQLRLSSEAARAEVEASIVPVRNQLLLYLSSLTIADTTGADNKREIQKRVKRIANESMPSSRITQVYFTEFVIQ